jgi:glycosyltransferase involved in cell wall biosynthesis
VLRTPARAYLSHDIHPAIPVWLASRARGSTLVYDAHELWCEPYSSTIRARIVGRLNALLERLMVRAADAVITTNDSRVEVLRRRYARSDITVVANVPLLNDDVTPHDPGYPEGKRTVLFLGRISARGRAFREIVAALRLLEDDIELVIVGFGWESERDQIRMWARDAGTEHRVHFLPPLPYDQLAAAAAAATVGVVPIYAEQINEALGDTNKLHEYLMGGLPVVASDLPEIRRVVSSTTPSVGELFDPRSPESIASAINAVIEDPLYEERRAQARNLARERLNWSNEERTLMTIYGRLLDRGDAAPTTALLEGT